MHHLSLKLIEQLLIDIYLTVGANRHVFYSMNSIMIVFLMSPIQIQKKLIKFILEDSVTCWNQKNNDHPVVHQRHVLTILLTIVHGRHVLWLFFLSIIQHYIDMQINMNKETDKYKVYDYVSIFSYLVKHVVWCSLKSGSDLAKLQ